MKKEINSTITFLGQTEPYQSQCIVCFP